jgi:hypothetical protein
MSHQEMLQRFDFERVLIDQMISFDRDALQARAATDRSSESWAGHGAACPEGSINPASSASIKLERDFGFCASRVEPAPIES